MRKLIVDSLQFFSAFVTVDGVRDIFIAAIGAGFGLRPVLHHMTTARAKSGAWREVFIAGGTLIEHKLLMAALWTEFSVNWD